MVSAKMKLLIATFGGGYTRSSKSSKVIDDNNNKKLQYQKNITTKKSTSSRYTRDIKDKNNALDTDTSDDGVDISNSTDRAVDNRVKDTNVVVKKKKRKSTRKTSSSRRSSTSNRSKSSGSRSDNRSTTRSSASTRSQCRSISRSQSRSSKKKSTHDVLPPHIPALEEDDGIIDSPGKDILDTYAKKIGVLRESMLVPPPNSNDTDEEKEEINHSGRFSVLPFNVDGTWNVESEYNDDDEEHTLPTVESSIESSTATRDRRTKRVKQQDLQTPKYERRSSTSDISPQTPGRKKKIKYRDTQSKRRVTVSADTAAPAGLSKVGGYNTPGYLPTKYRTPPSSPQQRMSSSKGRVKLENITIDKPLSPPSSIKPSVVLKKEEEETRARRSSDRSSPKVRRSKNMIEPRSQRDIDDRRDTALDDYASLYHASVHTDALDTSDKSKETPYAKDIEPRISRKSSDVSPSGRKKSPKYRENEVSERKPLSTQQDRTRVSKTDTSEESVAALQSFRRASLETSSIKTDKIDKDKSSSKRRKKKKIRDQFNSSMSSIFTRRSRRTKVSSSKKDKDSGRLKGLKDLPPLAGSQREREVESFKKSIADSELSASEHSRKKMEKELHKIQHQLKLKEAILKSKQESEASLAQQVEILTAKLQEVTSDRDDIQAQLVTQQDEAKQFQEDTLTKLHRIESVTNVNFATLSHKRGREVVRETNQLVTDLVKDVSGDDMSVETQHDEKLEDEAMPIAFVKLDNAPASPLVTDNTDRGDDEQRSPDPPSCKSEDELDDSLSTVKLSDLSSKCSTSSLKNSGDQALEIEEALEFEQALKMSVEEALEIAHRPQLLAELNGINDESKYNEDDDEHSDKGVCIAKGGEHKLLQSVFSQFMLGVPASLLSE